MSVLSLLSPCCKYRKSILQRIIAPLDSAVAKALETHLAQCSQCRDYQHQVEWLHSGLRQLKTNEPVELPTDSKFRRQWQQSICSLPALHRTGRQAFPVLAFPRVAWTGLAAVWLLILFFHWTAPPVPTVPGGISPAQGVLAFNRLRQHSSPIYFTVSTKIPIEPRRPPIPRSDKGSSRPALLNLEAVQQADSSRRYIRGDKAWPYVRSANFSPQEDPASPSPPGISTHNLRSLPIDSPRSVLSESNIYLMPLQSVA